MKKSLIVTLTIVLIFLSFFILKPNNKKIMENNPANVTQDSSENCYARSTEKTTDKPFSVDEYMKLKIEGTNVEGFKFGFQSGPGYSNGYNGTLLGTQTDTEILVDYAYIVEGSKNTEQEVYKEVNGSIERIQYVLTEKNNMLVPDRTQEVGRLMYSPIDCSIFEEKSPK